MMAHRSKNVNNVEAHVNGPKKEHDGNYGKDYGEGHSEQAREGAHQSRSATPGMRPHIVQALSPRGSCEKKTGIQIAALARYIHQYYGQRADDIQQTDHDHQHCRVTDKEARDEYYSSTPDGADIFTKPLAEDKFYASWKQMCGHEPELPEAKDDGPAPESMGARANQRRAEKIQRLVQLDEQKTALLDVFKYGCHFFDHKCNETNE
jgi:hypothetical protein